MSIQRSRPDALTDVNVVLDNAAQQLGFSVLDTGHQLILRQLRKKILKKVAVIRDHVNPNFRPQTMLLKVRNPDSAVPINAMSEEQTFRSEVNGSLPLSGYRSSVVQDEI